MVREPRLNSKKKKLWIYVGVFAVWLISLSGVFGNSGIVQAYKLAQVRRDMSLRITALENEKFRLATSLKDLESDSFVQEQTIRETLGFVRENELIFEFR